jgi:hypothetical protein
MPTKSARWYAAWFAGLFSLVISACGGGAVVPSGTATAQAQRAQALATQMALNLRATDVSQAKGAQATQQAFQTFLNQSASWPTIIDDGFDQKTLGWPEGDDTDPLAVINWTIEGGKFRWKATANDSFVWWVYPTMDAVTDFSLSVQMQQTSGAVDGEGGLIYRVQEPGLYYTFELNGLDQYAVYSHLDDGWHTLIDWSDSDAIREDAPNQLTVVATGSHFEYFINQQNVASLDDASITDGMAGLLIGLSQAEDQGSWEFDDFKLSTPDGQPTSTP